MERFRTAEARYKSGERELYILCGEKILAALTLERRGEMIRNGQLYCDTCNIVILKSEVSVRVQRPDTSGNHPDDFAHFHRRHLGDCFDKTLEKAKALAQSRKPTQLEFSEFEKWRINEDAKRTIAGSR